VTDETNTQRILVVAKTAWSHRKWIAALVASMVTGVIGTSVAWGGYVERMSGDKAQIDRIEKKLDAKIESDNAANSSRDMKQARLEEKVDAVHEDIRDFKDWKDRITGVAETVRVPKLGRHPK
jgi:hypothetical protein